MRNSLRIEFLFNLAFLATAAVLLAFWTARTLAASGVPALIVLALVGAAVVAFVMVGNYLIEKWVLHPLAAIGRSADAIATGEYDHRVVEEGPEEIVSLARALNHLTDQLLENQHRLAENVRSLDETNSRLTATQSELVQAEKMASLGKLAAGVAHEIGNPLGAIIGYVGIQKRRGGDPELLEGLEREARRIDRIVRGLLEYARPGVSAREPIDVNQSVKRVVELLREQGRLSGIEVDLQLAHPLPPVLADGHRLDQVFVNLLQNAESAIDGKGRIVVHTGTELRQPEIPTTVRRADDPPGVNYAHLRRARSPGRVVSSGERAYVRVTVRDTGPGIPDDVLSSIFDPFFTTKDPGQGTGLGLAIVAGTVAEMGGRIEASSPPSGGAEFDILLPAVEAA